MSKLKRHLPILFLIILGSLGHSPLYGQLNKAYYYYKSEELISQGRYSESLPVLNTLIGIDSSLFEGWFLRGVAKYNLGDIRGAISDFDKSLKANPLSAQSYHYKAIALSQVSEYDKALKEISSALELRPNSPDFLFTLGVLQFQTQNYPKAIGTFTRVIQLESSNADAWYNRATAKLLIADTLGAISDYSTTINVNPFHAAAYARRGAVNAELDRNHLALADLNRAIELDSLKADFYFTRAIINYNFKKYQNSIDDLTKALRLNPNYQIALFNRAIINYQAGNTDPAIDDLTRLMAINSQNVLVPYYRGSIYLEKGEATRSIDDFTKAISLFPDFANAYLLRSDAKRQLGNLPGAEEDFLKGQALANKFHGKGQAEISSLLDSSGKLNKLISLESDFNLASTLSIESNRIRIASAFMPMIRLHFNQPDKPATNINLASVYLDSINATLPINYKLIFGFAPSNLTEKLSIESADSTIANFPALCLVKGIFLAENGKFASATNEFKKAFEQNSSNPIYLFSYIMNNVEMAEFIENFNTSTEISGIAMSSSKNTGITSITAYNDAIVELKGLYEVFPKNGLIAYNLGNLSIMTNDYESAISWFSLAVRENPLLSCAWFNKGLSLLITGNKDEGCNNLGKAGELGVEEAYMAIKKFCTR